jgi:drug/metabolite transporter (DMT)-like permease
MAAQASPPLAADGTPKAIAALIGATAVFAASDVAAKLLTETMSTLQVGWFRYLVFAAVVVPLLVTAQGRRRLETRFLGLQIGRGLALAASTLLFIGSVSLLPVAEATAINFIAPVFIMLLAIVLLGERVGLSRWIAAGLGLVGVVIIVQPGTSAFQPAVLLPLAAALSWAGAAIWTRRMRLENPLTTMTYTALAGAAAMTVLVLFVWKTPTMWEALLGVIGGIFSTAGHWLLIVAYSRAPASLLAPFHYVQLIFAAAFGYVAFGDVPGAATLIGAAVIVAGGLYNARMEQLRRRADLAEAGPDALPSV